MYYRYRIRTNTSIVSLFRRRGVQYQLLKLGWLTAPPLLGIVQFWFTEAGERRFRNEVLPHLEELLPQEDEVVVTKVECPIGPVVYRDLYQIAVRKK